MRLNLSQGQTLDAQVFIFHGTGANGKSTLIETIRSMLGDYATQTDFSTFKRKKFDGGIRNDIARLMGARFVSAVESGRDDYLDEVLIKQLTGGDTITARLLYKEAFEFKNTGKIIIAANYKPRIVGTDHAIWRRVKLIPFDVTIPDDKIDRELPEKLHAELPGILASAVRGCLEWQKHGLQQPPDVKTASESYRLEMNSLDPFLKECCREDPAGKVQWTLFYKAYSGWCRRKKFQPSKKKDVTAGLEDRGLSVIKISVDQVIGLVLVQ